MRFDEDEDEREDRRGFGVHAPDPSIWVPAVVRERLVEAARVILRTAGPIGPRGYPSGFPRELLEGMGYEEAPVDPEPARNSRIMLSPRRITMVEQASHWPLRYLREQDGARRVLALFLACKAYREPFKRAVDRKGWSRATAYRRRDQALGIIAHGLNSDQIPVEL